MVCTACGARGKQRWGSRLCEQCRLGLRRGQPRPVARGLTVVPAFRHGGTARILVHQLKYAGSRTAAQVLAQAMVRRLPSEAVALVPIPRSVTRRLRFGVDPARELAAAMEHLSGIPMVMALAGPLWAPTHAGRGRVERTSRGMRLRRAPPGPVVLVDDVVTTGRTLREAGRLLGPRVVSAITATGAGV